MKILTLIFISCFSLNVFASPWTPENPSDALSVAEGSCDIVNHPTYSEVRISFLPQESQLRPQVLIKNKMDGKFYEHTLDHFDYDTSHDQIWYRYSLNDRPEVSMNDIALTDRTIYFSYKAKSYEKLEAHLKERHPVDFIGTKRVNEGGFEQGEQYVVTKPSHVRKVMIENCKPLEE